MNSLLFRRYTAKLHYEIDFWSRFASDGGTPDGYAERLTEATGLRYRPENYLADMDAGFYSADYLRAWIRNAQLREYLVGKVGEDWWRSPETGDLLRELFREGAKPTSEEIAERLGYNPLDTAPLLHEASRLVRVCQSALTPSIRRRTVHLNRVSGLGLVMLFFSRRSGRCT